jgi:hypothetical protein
MANRSNRRRVSLSRTMAFEAAFPISPRRADAHHGQEAQPSTNRSDIRAQSHLGAGCVIRSRSLRVDALIPIPVAKTSGPIHRRAECDELSTAARPPASEKGALPAGRPWITLRHTLIRPPPEKSLPTFPCLSGGVHIRPTRIAMQIPWMTLLANVLPTKPAEPAAAYWSTPAAQEGIPLGHLVTVVGRPQSDAGQT